MELWQKIGQGHLHHMTHDPNLDSARDSREDSLKGG